MTYRPRELQNKQDAHVLEVTPIDATRRMQLLGTETIGHPSPHMVAALVAKLERRGEVSRLNGALTRNPQSGLWEMTVIRRKPAAPAWRLPLLIGAGALAVAGGLLWLLLSVVASLAAIPVSAVVVGGLGGVLLLKVVKPGGRTFSGTFRGRVE